MVCQKYSTDHMGYSSYYLTAYMEVEDWIMEIICDNCGKTIITPEWKTICDGEIEYTLNTSKRAGVTDDVLRQKMTAQ